MVYLENKFYFWILMFLLLVYVVIVYYLILKFVDDVKILILNCLIIV